MKSNHLLPQDGNGNSTEGMYIYVRVTTPIISSAVPSSQLLEVNVGVPAGIIEQFWIRKVSGTAANWDVKLPRTKTPANDFDYACIKLALNALYKETSEVIIYENLDIPTMDVFYLNIIPDAGADNIFDVLMYVRPILVP